MSNPQRELSNEILKIIFFYLPRYRNSKKILGQCALTCHGWRLVAQSLIFHSLKLKNENDIEDIKSMISHNYMIEQWTRRLTIEFHISKSSTLIAIDELLPRIESFSLSAALLLLDNDEFGPQRTDTAYSFLHEVLAKDNKFNNLKMLPMPITITQRKLYVECLYFIRNNITDIIIDDMDNENRLLCANLCNNLHLFSHLKSFYTIVRYNKSLDVIGYCESLLSKKNLSSTFLQEIKIHIMYSTCFNSSTLSEQDNIFPASNIKSVSIVIDYDAGELRPLKELGDNLMIYITKKFPNLYFLELSFDYAKVRGFSKIKRISLLENEGPNRIKQLAGVMCQFLNHIYKIPYCRVENFLVSKKEHTVQILQKLFKEGITSSVPTLPNYNNWEEPSFIITLEAGIFPESSKIDACAYFQN